jgi:hypothetical protein
MALLVSYLVSSILDYAELLSGKLKNRTFAAQQTKDY